MTDLAGEYNGTFTWHAQAVFKNLEEAKKEVHDFLIARPKMSKSDSESNPLSADMQGGTCTVSIRQSNRETYQFSILLRSLVRSTSDSRIAFTIVQVDSEKFRMESDGPEIQWTMTREKTTTTVRFHLDHPTYGNVEGEIQILPKGFLMGDFLQEGRYGTFMLRRDS